jgi:peroxiredoxin
MDSARRSLLVSVASLAIARKLSTSTAEPTPQSTSPAPAVDTLPSDLPVPADDGASRHLLGMALPNVRLRSTADRWVTLTNIPAPRVIVYCYPMTGVPGKPLPAGWDDIPGARGCTPETCGFRNHHKELLKLGAEVFGMSTQTTSYQQEMVNRLHVPFEVLSDQHLRFTRAMRLPTLVAAGMVLLKRLTLVVSDNLVEKVFYPVFPPDTHAEEVVAWLTRNPKQ